MPAMLAVDTLGDAWLHLLWMRPGHSPSCHLRPRSSVLADAVPRVVQGRVSDACCRLGGQHGGMTGYNRYITCDLSTARPGEDTPPAAG